MVCPEVKQPATSLIWPSPLRLVAPEQALLHFRKLPHWILDASKCLEAPSRCQTKTKGNSFPLNFQSDFQKQRYVEMSSYRN